ncbi:trypsin-like serine peptidase [Dokdonella koreensis]|uniref:Serine protease n=1 Tax=Dokdonella koreensis DS-123 TaxID=1300342 RepID=A0A160DUR7_9GAMM|nr:serine protease [Dokdonella koreensis]ANB18024.1 Hypothetical protein I596_2004 [Dokdonella koreensis DS-123]
MHGKTPEPRSARTSTAVATSLLALLALAQGPQADAIPPSTGLPTINYWRDACEVDAGLPETAELKRVVDATAFIIDPALIHFRVDTQSYEIQTSRFTAFDGYTFSPSSHFYDEQVIYFAEGHPGRSAFLVGPDSIVTTPHTASWADLNGYYVLFGYDSVPDGTGGCLEPDLAHFPPEKVRRISGHLNGYGVYGDYLVGFLDQPVLDRPFLRVRRDGHAEIGDEATVVGHPARLAKKMDTAGRIAGLSGDTPLVQTVHTLRFSSGSPLYNLTRQYVELAVAYGGGCARYVCVDPSSSGCRAWDLVSQCPSTPSALNNSIKPFAAQLDPLTLQVTPLSVYTSGMPGTGFSQPVTTYTLGAPVGGVYASATIDYRIDPPDAAAGGPYLSILSSIPLSGTLAAGQTLSFDVEAVMPPAQDCGIFPREFAVHDLTHGFTDRVRQTLEVGYTAFSVPERLLELDGIEQPYQATRALTIENLRTTAASIRVRADQAWLTLDGVEGTPTQLPQRVLTIPGGQSATVMVGLAPAATALTPNTTHQAGIVVESTTTTCNLTAPITVAVGFAPGTLTLRQAVGAAVPPATSNGPHDALVSSIDVPETFCIDQVVARYHFDHLPGSYATTTWLTESGWQLQRPGGSGRWTPLWDQNIAPSCSGIRPDPPEEVCYLYSASKDECLFTGTERQQDCEVVALGNARRPVLAACPPTDPSCEPLADLAGQPAHGLWSMTIDDRIVDGVTPQPVVRGWSLQFRGSGTCTGK